MKAIRTYKKKFGSMETLIVINGLYVMTMLVNAIADDDPTSFKVTFLLIFIGFVMAFFLLNNCVVKIYPDRLTTKKTIFFWKAEKSFLLPEINKIVMYRTSIVKNVMSISIIYKAKAYNYHIPSEQGEDFISHVKELGIQLIMRK